MSKSFMNTAYTAPVSGTTSIRGSYWPWTFRHSQMNRSGPNVFPPFLETCRIMAGSGQLFLQAFAPPYRLCKM